MYFLALSHAPPPLFRTVASRTPAIVPTISMPATASAAEEDADDDRRGDRDDARQRSSRGGRPGRDVDDPGVVRALGVVHDPGHLAELAADLDDDRLGRRCRPRGSPAS